MASAGSFGLVKIGLPAGGGARRLEDELCRHRLRPPQNPEHGTANGPGPGGDPLGQDGQRDEQRHDAPYRPFVPPCRTYVHVHALR
jgi:hypothetical protein